MPNILFFKFSKKNFKKVISKKKILINYLKYENKLHLTLSLKNKHNLDLYQSNQILIQY